MLIDQDFLAESSELSNDDLRARYVDELILLDSHTITFEDSRLIMVRMLIAAYNEGFARGVADEKEEQSYRDMGDNL